MSGLWQENAAKPLPERPALVLAECVDGNHKVPGIQGWMPGVGGISRRTADTGARAAEPCLTLRPPGAGLRAPPAGGGHRLGTGPGRWSLGGAAARHCGTPRCTAGAGHRTAGLSKSWLSWRRMKIGGIRDAQAGSEPRHKGCAGKHEVVVADLLKQAHGLVAIQILGDGDPGQTADLSKGLVGEVHVAQREAIPLAAHLPEAGADPAQQH